MRQALQLEERELASSAPGRAKVVTCSSISPLPKRRITASGGAIPSVLAVAGKQSDVDPLHSHLDDSLYRKEWLGDHKQSSPR